MSYGVSSNTVPHGQPEQRTRCRERLFCCWLRDCPNNFNFLIKARFPLSAFPSKVFIMLSHDRVWAAIDALAARYGMTASGLARKAGLDATSFNRSKRTSPEGRDRWPSTESISKILRATGASLDEFMKLVEPDVEQRLARMTVPLV